MELFDFNRCRADGHAIRRRVPNETQTPNVVFHANRSMMFKNMYRKRFYKSFFIFYFYENTSGSDDVCDTKNINLLRPVWQRDPFDLARRCPYPVLPIMCRQHCQKPIVRYLRCYGINTCFPDLQRSFSTTNSRVFHPSVLILTQNLLSPYGIFSLLFSPYPRIQIFRP